jgi:hypothetical protein
MAPIDHPTPRSIDQFVAGELTGPAGETVLRHLLGGCLDCSIYARGILERRTTRAGAPPGGYEAAFELGAKRTAEESAEVLAERLRATTLWAILESKPHERRLALVAGDRRYHSWALAARLLEVAADLHWRGPGRAVEATRLAVAVIDHLQPGAYPPGLVHDLRGRALGGLANALRLGEDYAAARAAFTAAWDELAQGTGDPLERAHLFYLEATLLLAAGDFGGAADQLRPAAHLYRLYGDAHQESRILRTLALATGYLDPLQGVALARQALQLVHRCRDPRLELSIRHALIWFLNDGGSPREALALLDRSRELYRQFESAQPRLCQTWLEARIIRSLGEPAAAERTLVAVWHDFRSAGFNQDLTLVSLDLAEAYIAQGKVRHALRLLKSFQLTLRAWRMHANGLAAWLLLQEAAATEAARAQALTRDASLYFRQAWRRPFPFRPSQDTSPSQDTRRHG